MSKPTTIVWFRRDLRLADHQPLRAAAKRGRVIPVYIDAPNDDGAASKWWLHQSLARLQESLEKIASRLILRQGDPLDELQSLVKSAGADRVYWQRLYEPEAIARDKKIKVTLRKQNIEVQSFPGALLREPWQVETQQGGPYKVFTPYWRTHQQLPQIDKPLPAPKQIDSPARWPKSKSLDALGLMPSINWYSGIDDAWTPGEKGAAARLKTFLSEAVSDYPSARDVPSKTGTSLLSPHLHFGEISARQIYHATLKNKQHPKAGQEFLREVGWRDFAHHILFYFPHTTTEPMQEKYKAFPWKKNAKWLRAWQKGETGYPIVDAGMRQLWSTGYMHNRVRMVVASFLVKDLLIHWRDGAAWFWDTLVDADLANNTLGWQWAAGCGADAAPYFRIFNPTTQGKKFDPQGDYVRRWVPHLADIPAKFVHEPWKSDLDLDYPDPIVDHSKARKRALEALAEITTP